MSQKYFGKGISVGSGFDLGANLPLDNRTVAATIAERDLIPAIQLYKGLPVYVESEQKTYILTSFDADGSNRIWKTVGEEIQVVNSLDSVSAVAALSAAQGKVLKDLIDNKPSAEYSVVKAETAEEGFSATYNLTKDGVAVGASINIPKDLVVESGSVKTVLEYGIPYEGAVVGHKYLDLVLANSSSSHIYIPVNDLVEDYAGEGYIVIDGTTRKVSLDFDTLKADLGVQSIVDRLTLVENSNNSVVSIVGSSESGLVKEVADLTTVVSNKVDKVEGASLIPDAKLNQIETNRVAIEDINEAISGIQANIEEIKVKDVDTSAINGISLTLSEEGVVGASVDIDVLATEIISKHAIDASTIKLGSNIGTTANPDRYTTEDTVQGVLGKLNERIEAIDADIQSALEGGVTGIEAGNGITVDASVPTKPMVAIKTAANSSLVATADGLDIAWIDIE